MFPSLKEKTSVFYNIIDKNKVDIMSLEDGGFNDCFNGIRILTVGRLTTEKGQDIIPGTLRRILSKGYSARWYCMGDGENRQMLGSMIKEFNLEDHLILLGTQNNPFPYIKQCDIYVQPSRHEGYCITLAEARALNKPIITTDFVGAREQIKDRETGLITEFSEEEIYKAVKKLIGNTDLCDMFKNNLKENKMGFISGINEFEKFAEGIK